MVVAGKIIAPLVHLLSWGWCGKARYIPTNPYKPTTNTLVIERVVYKLP